MATYYHGNSEIQGGGGGDGLQTLVLMNPGYIQYSDVPPPQHGGNLVFLNSAAATVAGNNSFLTPAPPHGQQFVSVPLDQSSHHDISSAAVAMHGLASRGHYNLWNTIDTNNGAREATRATQGLSLSLPAMSGEDVRISGGSPSSASGVTNVNGGGVLGIQSVLLSSKYLKATQEVLEEVVNVNKDGGDITNEKIVKKSFEKNKDVGESSCVGGDGEKGVSELSATERQEIHIKKAKLIAMLDEVVQRYRQYQNQMQIIISSFEQVAGIGSARTYTALALKTISKQFRCLKECITEQIKALNKTLGGDNEDDYCFGGGNNRIEGASSSRLKYVDHHLRQQRAIQQLGMMHHHNHNAWRPQRGLPERSVSVLRAWLFEHFLHPYPKDSDKQMLAKQTGLTRSQVSNWFINARVRLWKPMVEEMYLEEMKDHEMNNNCSEEKSNKNIEDSALLKSASSTQGKGPNSETEHKSFNPKQDVSTIVSVSTALSTTTSPPPQNLRNNNNSGFSFNIGSSSSELDGITQGNSPKKPRNNNNNEIMMMNPSSINNDQLSMKFGGDDDDDDQGRDDNNNNGYSFIGNQTNFISGFGQYPIDEITRFDAEQFTTTTTTRFSSGNSNNNNNSNNGVSLTLGLPHCDTISGTHQTFLQNQNIQLGMRLEMSETSEFGASSAAAFEGISSINNMQNPKRFAAQLLPDFVA